MTIAPCRPLDILRSMAEFDQTLRDSRHWGGWVEKKNHKYAIEHEKRVYPVKYIISMASGTPVKEFGGGHEANSYARKRGFKVIRLKERLPNWCRDELIVALDFYLRNRKHGFKQGSQEIEELSILLKRIGRQLLGFESETFRNTNGVMKRIGNFQYFDPDYSAKGFKNGGALCEEVWNEFGQAPRTCKKEADLIIQSLDELEESQDDYDNGVDDSFEAEEGRVVEKRHKRRERDKKIVAKKKNSVLNRRGHLSCEACGITFKDVYGERGRDFIECHHTKPVHTMKPGEKTKLNDLVLLCANCHRMVHTGRPWPSVEELRELDGLQRLREHFEYK